MQLTLEGSAIWIAASSLISIGMAWGYVKVKLKEMDTMCDQKQAACRNEICGKIDNVLRELKDMKKNNQATINTLQAFMLEMREWKGKVDERLNDGDRRIEILESSN